MPGKEIVAGVSQLITGLLGPCNVGLKGWALGETTAETKLSKITNRVEIMSQQNGANPDDHVNVGINYQLDTVFKDISTQKLRLLIPSFQSAAAEDGGGVDSGFFGSKLFCSLKDTFAGALRVAPINCDGEESDDIQDILNAYKVLPMVDEELINWSIETQKQIAVVFYIYREKFGDDQVIDGPASGFAYYGDPALEKVPATDWPDLTGPQLTSADASAETTIDLTFDVNVALQGGSYSGGIIVKVNDEWVVPTGVVVATNTSEITLPASSISNGDTVEISISDGVYEDTETTANIMDTVNNYAVTNSVT